MLRIHHNDTTTQEKILRLEGNIVWEWSDLLESECLALVASGFAVALDLSSVVFVGISGIDALRRLRENGVRITHCPPLIAEVLEQEGIDVDRDVEPTTDVTTLGDREPR